MYELKISFLTNWKMVISNMTKLFSNSSSKIPKREIFGPKFKNFYFCTKLCSKTNSRALISNMTLVFTNSTPKILKSGIFGPKFKDFSFCTRLCNNANSRVLISNMTMFSFKIATQNTQIRHFFKFKNFIFALNFAF